MSIKEIIQQAIKMIKNNGISPMEIEALYNNYDIEWDDVFYNEFGDYIWCQKCKKINSKKTKDLCSCYVFCDGCEELKHIDDITYAKAYHYNEYAEIYEYNYCKNCERYKKWR